MSSSPRTVVDAGMYGVGAASKVEYTNRNNSATPLFHVAIFLGACFDRRLSLLISLRTRQGMPLTKRLERRKGLFLDSASTLFFGGGKSGSGDLPEDNSSSAVASLLSGRIGSLPFFLFNRGCRVVAPSCIFASILFQTSPQVIVLLLYMISTALQFSHLSSLFFLLCLHILMPVKELVFKGLIC